MAEIREVLYQYHKGATQRSIEKSLCVSRNSIRKYIAMATDLGYGSDVTNDELGAIALKVHSKISSTAASNRPNESKKSLEAHHEKITSLLTEQWITHIQIYRILSAEGLISSRRSLSRYIAKHFPSLPKATVHLLTTPGHEAQVDYAFVGVINKKKTLCIYHDAVP